jgi:alpha-D-ribose 1-methylphosphonate 5-triphosphate diphosphatase
MWLTDVKMVLPDGVIEHGAINVQAGCIAAIIEGAAPVKGLNASGLTVIPGIIDLHGDMLERDIEPRPSAMFPVQVALHELDKRLAGAGITTAYAAVGFAWHQNDLRTQAKATEIIRAVKQYRDHLMVDFRVHARFEIENTRTAPILQSLLDENLVDLVSLMDHTPGQGQYSNLERYVDFMVKWLGIPRDLLENQAKEKMVERMQKVAEVERDWGAAEEICKLAQRASIPLASHDDDTHAKIDRMRSMGITISEFPVTMEAARYAREQGIHIIMGAPNAFRGESNTGNLSAMSAIRAGLVDILATDYYPAAMLHAAFRIAREGVLPLHESIKLITDNPAQAVRLHDRGRLEVGLSADLVLVQEFEDYPRIRAVLREGHPIYWDAHMAHLSQLTPKVEA